MGSRSQLRCRGLALFALAALSLGAGAAPVEPPAVAAAPPPRPGTFSVVIDPGHGGPDFGGEGAGGALEKDVVLQIARRFGRELEQRGLLVSFTRDSDEFVSLSRRTDIANDARADLFLSVHANTAPDGHAHGFETYFLSLQASDEDARRVALVENDVFDQSAAAPDSGDIVGGILSDMIRTQHLRESSEVAAAIQRRTASVAGVSRGVKQAPFIVLMGVNMPAALVEIGFLTHAAEERRLRSSEYQGALAKALAEAVSEFAAARVSASRREQP